jgi:pimeloyl-ACP methyl ester carboxylesterase
VVDDVGVSGESLLIDVDGGRLYGERWAGGASGPPLILLHAGVCDRRSWQAAAPALTAMGDVVAYDRRGFGETPSGTRDFRHVDDLLRVLDEVTGEPAWLIGSSNGGGLALDAALTHPGRVAGLVLLSPGVSGSPDGDEGLDPDTERLAAALTRALDEGDLATANRLETWLWLDGPAGPENRVSGPARDLALAMNGIVLANGAPEGAGRSGLDTWSQLETIGTTTLVAWGDLDIPLLIEECRTLVARLPKADHYVIEGTAHLPYLERPDTLSDVVRKALKAG